MTSRIPKTLHVYWEGPLPYLRLLTVVSFRRLHPDYAVTLHTATTSYATRWETGEHSIPYTGPDYRDALAGLVDDVSVVDDGEYTPTMRSDFRRADVLAEVGGVWSGMDVLWVQPLTALGLAADVDVATVFVDGVCEIMLAAPGTAYFAKLGHLARTMAKPDSYQSAGPEALLACGGHADVAREFPDLVFADLPAITFYPIWWNQTAQLVHETVELPPETVGVHWFGGDAAIETFLNAYPTPEALRTVDNTLTATLRRLELL